ncbi:MAG: TonB-dependent receptor domain-containing protein, partial [Bryobacteraceae bacterium]
MDHNFSDKLRVFGRTSISWLNGGDAGSALQPFFYPESNHRYSVSVGLTWSLTPATIVELFGGWVRTAQLDPQAVPTDTKQLGFSPAYDAAMPVPNLAPGLNVASYETILGRGTRWDNEGPWSFNSNVTHIFGRHNLKAGFQTDIYQANSGGVNPPVLNFTGGFTQGPNPTTTGANIGSGLADLLLGTFASGSFSSPTNAARTRKYYGLYVQEDYRVTSRLSLNLGLRWDGWQRVTDRFNGQNIGWAYNTPNPVQGPAAANYALQPIPELSVGQFSSAMTGGYLFADPDHRAAGASQLNNWSPRFGFAYRVTDKTVLRGGYGLFKSFLYWGAASSTGFTATTDAVGTIDGITPYNLLNNPFPLGVTQPSGASLGLLTSVGSSATFTDQNLTPQTMTRWNFGIQRQLSGNMVVEAQYVGSTFFNTTVGNVSAISGTGDPNSLALHNISNQIFTTLGPTGRLNQTVPNPFFGV